MPGPEHLRLGGLGVPQMPNPLSNGSKSTMRSYLTRNFFLGPEK